MPQQIQSRRGTASQWTTANTLLAAGEIGAETDTGRFKIGNGSTTWNSLNYSLGFRPMGAWSSATAYLVNDLITYNGSSYFALLSGTNQNPSTATTYWQLLSAAGSNGTNGNTILNGAAAPTSGQGSNGDYYLETTNTVLYGPKAAGAWPGTGVSLKGSITGSTGATDKALIRANGTAGATVQNSVVTISDAGVMANAAVQNTVFAVTDGASVDLSFANGEIQTWTLGANRTPTATTLASGQGITLVITAGTFSITWTTIGVLWTKQGGGGMAPTLSSTLKSTVILWKVGFVVYGSYLGDA